MTSITIGDVLVRSDGESLIFTHQKEPDVAVRLDYSGVGELMDFLRSVVESEINQRKAFRVPVLRSSGLIAIVRWHARVFEVRPLNLSLVGAFIERSESEPYPFEVDDHVHVDLLLGTTDVALKGIILRQTSSGYGISFPDCLDDEKLGPPPALSRIVMELQRQWITARAG